MILATQSIADHLILPDRLAESLNFDATSFLRSCFD